MMCGSCSTGHQQARFREPIAEKLVLSESP
jgi:hypothetical protein